MFFSASMIFKRQIYYYMHNFRSNQKNTFLLLGLVAFITIAGTTISANIAFGQFGLVSLDIDLQLLFETLLSSMGNPDSL